MTIIPEYAGGTDHFRDVMELHHATLQGGGPSYQEESRRLRQRLLNIQGQIKDAGHGYYIITPDGDWYGPECTEKGIRRCSESDFSDTDHTIVLVIDKVDAKERDL